ncbi:MAG: DinB family protein [Gammaproteobacteria bacterium]|nr:DinB family protein [Gammaproteobacteria bacterium]
MIKLHAVPSQANTSVALMTLISACEKCIEQCDEVLEPIPESVFIRSFQSNSPIGSHVRHVIERFDCFFNGCSGGTINYDQRKRDRKLEQSLSNARAALAAIRRSLSQLGSSRNTSLVVVESVNENCAPVAVDSTLERELMGLVSHTTHHLAIIGLLVKAQGYRLSADFGKAPSTLIYERNNE